MVHTAKVTFLFRFFFVKCIVVPSLQKLRCEKLAQFQAIPLHCLNLNNLVSNECYISSSGKSIIFFLPFFAYCGEISVEKSNII